MSTYYIAGFPITDELYHHGIKGQRWGIRRYQNEDGSLTPAGRARYGTIENFNKIREEKRQDKRRHNEQRRARIQSYVDAKIKERQSTSARRREASIERGSQLEQAGYSHTKNLLKTAGRVAVNTIMTNTFSSMASQHGNKKLATLIKAGGTALNIATLYNSKRNVIDYENSRTYGRSK